MILLSVVLGIYLGISLLAGLFGVAVGVGLRGEGLALVQSFFLFAFLWPLFVWYAIVTRA